MQIKLNNSKLALLLPKDYVRVENGAELYTEMYHKRKADDIEMFQNVASESYGNIVVSHICAADAMPFDKEAVIKMLHETMEDNQGIIEVEVGENARGFQFIYSIVKTYHQEDLNVNYCVRMNIEHDDEIIEVEGSFFESRMTGMRSAIGWNLAMSAELEMEEGSSHQIKGWWQDPYDPEYKKGCLMIMCERPGLDGMFPSDPLSQARELVLALTEDSYYKTKEKIEADSDREKELENKKHKKTKDKTDASKSEDQEEGKDILRRMFSYDVKRAGAYKVDIFENAVDKKTKIISFNPTELVKNAAKAADGVKTAVAKTSAELDKVKTPFDIPDDFRCKLNQPVPKELPGWGKRAYIGFGKGSFAMSGICMSWPVTETESLPLSDTKGLIKQFHDDMDEHQGLISAKCGITPKGNRYAYAIRKLQFVDEKGEPQGPIDYELNFNIRINGKIHFINGSFQSRDGAPGSRGGALGIMQLGSSELKLEADEWVRDPYDPDRKKGFLMNWTEDEKYDGLFPYHPLSEVRQFVKYVVENN